MLSESQERMLIVLKPGREDEARAIFEKWELDFAVIGRVTDTGRLVLKFHGETVGDIEVAPLVDNAPEYDRPWEPTPKSAIIDTDDVAAPNDPMDALKRIVGSPNMASRRWIWEQYDHMVMADTNQRPGGDSAVVRIHGTDRALAITTDSTPRYCLADPEEGGKQAVAEAWRNLTAVGATPLAVTNNLNFGNPEKPRIMGQIAGAVTGMGAACRALDFPVVSGNVSLYNETSGEAILPTPVIGGLGLIDDLDRTTTVAIPREGLDLVLVGKTKGWLGSSLYLREIESRAEGAPPPVDLAAERRNGDFVRGLIQAGRVAACHDLSDGGLAVAAAEMAMAGGIGADLVDTPEGLALHGWLFGEDQARYLIAAEDGAAIVAEAQAAGVPAAVVGQTGGDALTVGKTHTISIHELRRCHEEWLPSFMARP
ncbi:MAG: phosphoribosylformylglycinamidine synthase II, partial [Alphaproteobacteria bacterium]|nr:phosphoribosylformylglycinamidine synthase II [Alphaproteobacteria bacterium]